MRPGSLPTAGLDHRPARPVLALRNPGEVETR
jgi:hypothetical protein